MSSSILNRINFSYQPIGRLKKVSFQSPTGRQFHSFHDDKQHVWSLLYNIHQRQFKVANKPYACLLLNLSDDVFHHFERLRFIWNDAALKLSVDGSTNFLVQHNLLHTADIVCGDFDSVKPELIQTLRQSTTKESAFLKDPKAVKKPQVIETPSQKETDFTKAIWVAMGMRPSIKHFFALYHSDGSRIDHIFGLINTLHLIKKTIVLINVRTHTVSWLIPPGSHVIQKPAGRDLCSIVPFLGSTEVKTSGLMHNLDPSNPIGFGSLISTSNICMKNQKSISIETNRSILWSIDLGTSSVSNVS